MRRMGWVLRPRVGEGFKLRLEKLIKKRAMFEFWVVSVLLLIQSYRPSSKVYYAEMRN